jgi:hypothetical protein
MELPAEMKPAMAKQGEVECERWVAIFYSQGELSAVENLRDAASKLAESSGLCTWARFKPFEILLRALLKSWLFSYPGT